MRVLNKVLLFFACIVLVLPNVVFAPCAPRLYPVDFSYPSGIINEGQSYYITATNPRSSVANITIYMKLVDGAFSFSESYLIEPNGNVTMSFMVPSVNSLSKLNYCFADHNLDIDFRDEVLITPKFLAFPNFFIVISLAVACFFLGYLVATTKQILKNSNID